MTKNKLRRIHIAIDPAVSAMVGGRSVKFVGANLLKNIVMIEYDVTPPLIPPSGFGPHLLVLQVSDDVSGGRYPTTWEDFTWPHIAPGRTTTRLDRRPPPQATRLHVNVMALTDAAGTATKPVSTGRRIASFEIPLPADHGLPWSEPGT